MTRYTCPECHQWAAFPPEILAGSARGPRCHNTDRHRSRRVRPMRTEEVRA